MKSNGSMIEGKQDMTNSYCEKCGGEMIRFQEHGSCGMKCTKCDWGWATTFTSPIDKDQTLYTLTIPAIESPSSDVIKRIADIFDCNYIAARKSLQEGSLFKTDKARTIQSVAIDLHQKGVVYHITPNFPFEIEDV